MEGSLGLLPRILNFLSLGVGGDQPHARGLAVKELKGESKVIESPVQ